MRHRLIFLVVVTLAGAWWWHTRQPANKVTSNDTTLASQSATSAATTEQTTDLTLTGEPTPNGEAPALTETQTDATEQALLAEIADRQYSEDTYLEIKSLSWQIGYCAHKDDLRDLFGNNPTDQQLALSDQVKELCAGYQSTHPNLITLYASNDWQQRFKPTSQLAQLYPLRKSGASKEEVQDYTREVVTQLLQVGNGALLLEEVFLGYLDPVELIFPVAQILGSGDTQYNQEVNKAALTLIACQFDQGQSCQPAGMFMLLNCTYEPNACGRDYPSWYADSTLPGMQRDVQLLVDYYLQLGHQRSVP